MDAQDNFARFGAKEERLVAHGRSPRDDETLDPGWRRIDRDADPYTEWGGESLSPGPADPTQLYYWRPGFWRTDPSSTLATYDPPTAVLPGDGISFDEALRIARAYVAAIQRGSGSSGLVERDTIEKPYGWVFVTLAVENAGESQGDSVINAPFVVRKRDGLIDILGAAHPVEHYLDLYEEGRWPSRGIRLAVHEDIAASATASKVGASSTANENVLFAALSKLIDWLKR